MGDIVIDEAGTTALAGAVSSVASILPATVPRVPAVLAPGSALPDELEASTRAVTAALEAVAADLERCTAGVRVIADAFTDVDAGLAAGVPR